MKKTNHDRTKPFRVQPLVPLKLLGGTLTLGLLLFPLALPSLAGYTPPPDATPPSGATSTSGGRNGSVQLTLLAPQQHVGQSQSTHPTFEWFIPTEQGLPGEFQLYEITGTGDIPETGEVQGEFRRVLETPYKFVSAQGFMSFTLPEEMEGLKPNTQYIWQVLLRYGPRTSDIYMVRAQIEIVERPLLTPPITEATLLTTTEQIEQRSEAGLWYDALSLTTQLSPNEADEQRTTLLLELADVEEEMSAGEITAGETTTEANTTEANTTEAMTALETPNSGQNSDKRSHSEALRQIADWKNSPATAQSPNPTEIIYSPGLLPISY